MFRTVLTLLAVLLLVACGNEQDTSSVQQSTPAASTAPAAAPSATPTAAAPDAMPAMEEEDTISYDPIDVSRLESAWWQQYSAGS